LPRIYLDRLPPPPLPRLQKPRAVVAVPPAVIVAATPVVESIAPPSVAQSAVPPQQAVIASEAPAASQPDDQLVCRRSPRSSETRLSGPSVCMTASAWAEMRMRGLDIAPDGRTVLTTGSFEKSRSVHPPFCVAKGMGCIASVSQAVLDPPALRK
jgi:hypothetical protein